MRTVQPTVAEGRVYDPRQPHSLRLDSPAWFAWLAAPSTTSFSYLLFDPARGYIVGRLTVRKERRRRGDAYWTAYHRRAGRLHKVYLGCSATLTAARLERVAGQVRR